MRDPGLELLGHLLEASHQLAPDDLVAAVARAAKAVEAEDVAIYLVDYEQTLLVPLPDGTQRVPLAIDSTLAGRAFTALAVQEAASGPGRRRGCRCWTAPNAWASSASPCRASTIRCGSGAAGWPPWSPS